MEQTPDNAAPAALDGQAPDPRRYRVGTLKYTRVGLIAVFFWLLWGSFFYTLRGSLVVQLLPLQLKAVGASDKAMAILVSTLPLAMNMVMNPIVSFRSDRYRGPWGRRRPFLIWPVPFMVLFLILLGFTRDIVAFVQSSALARVEVLSPLTVALAIVALMAIGYRFFELFVASVFYYLWGDVVPQSLMGRFTSLFRVVSNAAAACFSYFLFVHAKAEDMKYMPYIYGGVGLAFGVAFLLMCWQVKEGDYPPPPPNIKGPGVISAAATYFRECFTHWYYVCYFLGQALAAAAGACGIFAVFFQQSMGLEVPQIGKIVGVLTIITAALMYPAGMLADRVRPLRLYLGAMAALIAVNLSAFWIITDAQSLIVMWVLISIVTIPYLASQIAIIYTLVPRERFGQFSSATAMIGSLGGIAASAGAGAMMDWLHHDYRFMYIWAAAFYSVSLCFMAAVYWGWLRYGGREGRYVPPPAGPVSQPATH